MAVTLQNLTDIGYDILREFEDVKAYPLSFMQQLMNSAQLRICSGRVKNPFSGEFVRKRQLPFLNSTAFYTTYRDLTIDTLAVVGGSTLSSADTSTYPETGTIYLNGNLCPFTGNTDTGFTGVSNIQFAHKAGTQFGLAYSLPSDYMSPKNMIFQHIAKVPMKRYDDIFEEQNDVKGGGLIDRTQSGYFPAFTTQKSFYSIIDDTYIVFFNINSQGEMMMFRYEKLPTEMTTTSSTATIPNDTFAKATIPYIAIGEMFYNRGEEDRGAKILNFGLGQLVEMYDFYNNKSYEDINGVQYGIGKSRINI